MDAGPLDVLHDARDDNVLPVANGVHLDLLALDVFIHQDRMLLGDPVDDANEFVDIPVVDGDLHALAAQHIGRADKHRIA